jgi:HD-GYP domain-containing protein (c-di-GMP phosphodiesterase class II)
MRNKTTHQIEPSVIKVQGMLRKIDGLHLPEASRRDVESILVRRVANELDRLLPWQAGHSQETAAVALLIGQAAHLDDEVLHHLRVAALLHDIGLLMLPPQLQSGRSPLELDSYVTIQNHPRLGAALLEPFSFLREATIMIAHHHEHWDGSGYPYGLRGQFIPLGARILAVADAFEAIQVPNAIERFVRDHIALRILRVAAGTQFDPIVVNLLVELMEKTEFMYLENPSNRQHGRRVIDAASKWETTSSTRWAGPSPPEGSCLPGTNDGPRLSSLTKGTDAP